MTSKFTPLPPGTTRTRTTVDYKAAVRAETLLLTAALITPPIRRKQGPTGWCATEGEKAKLHTRWKEREDTRTRLRTTPKEAATKQLECARALDVQRGSLKHLSVNSKGVFEKAISLASRRTLREWMWRGSGTSISSTSGTRKIQITA